MISLNKRDTVGLLHVRLSCSKLGEWMLSYISRIIINLRSVFLLPRILNYVVYFCVVIHQDLSTQWMNAIRAQNKAGSFVQTLNHPGFISFREHATSQPRNRNRTVIAECKWPRVRVIVSTGKFIRLTARQAHIKWTYIISSFEQHVQWT